MGFEKIGELAKVLKEKDILIVVIKMPAVVI
jgi:hypothetical protein